MLTPLTVMVLYSLSHVERGVKILLAYEYQLQPIDPYDGIMLQTELLDYCDKLVVNCLSSEVLST